MDHPLEFIPVKVELKEEEHTEESSQDFMLGHKEDKPCFPEKIKQEDKFERDSADVKLSACGSTESTNPSPVDSCKIEANNLDKKTEEQSDNESFHHDASAYCQTWMKEEERDNNVDNGKE